MTIRELLKHEKGVDFDRMTAEVETAEVVMWTHMHEALLHASRIILQQSNTWALLEHPIDWIPAMDSEVIRPAIAAYYATLSDMVVEGTVSALMDARVDAVTARAVLGVVVDRSAESIHRWAWRSAISPLHQVLRVIITAQMIGQDPTMALARITWANERSDFCRTAVTMAHRLGRALAIEAINESD